MSILLDENTTVLVQGITGREGMARARFMTEYGTKVIGGVTPGRGGTDVWNISVYNTVKEAIQSHGQIDATVTFIPGPSVKSAVFEAIDAGIKLIVMPVERVPLHDILEMITYAKQNNTRIIGPGSLGIISPGKAVIGWIGGSEEAAREAFTPGHVAVLSRSGGQTTTICWAIKNSGLGVSTAIHVGAEPVLGSTFAELLPLLEEDDQTQAVVMFGEIGTVAEEEAAEVIEQGKFTKPAVAYVAGVMAQSGIRFSHASAIIERGRGTAQSKISSFKKAGVTIADKPEDIVPALFKLLKR